MSETWDEGAFCFEKWRYTANLGRYREQQELPQEAVFHRR